MTTITIKQDIALPKTEYDTVEDFLSVWMETRNANDTEEETESFDNMEDLVADLRTHKLSQTSRS